MDRSVLLQRLQNVYQRLVMGDPALTRKVAEWRRMAKAGDPRAKVVYNSLAVLHWSRKDNLAFAKAEVFYNRLRAYDRQAHAELRRLVARKDAGDAQARTSFSALKAVHHKRKASLWTKGPGAPRTGYYPLPSKHRVGIEMTPMTTPYLPLTPQAIATLVGRIRDILATAKLVRASDGGVVKARTMMVKPHLMTTTPAARVSTTVQPAVLASTVQSSRPVSSSMLRSLAMNPVLR